MREVEKFLGIELPLNIILAPMVSEYSCELVYLFKILNNIKKNIDDFDSYQFIITRTNDYNETQQFLSCLNQDKKIIVILLSDERGMIPKWKDKVHLIFRTYNRKDLYDNIKIFPIPCGYASTHDYNYNREFYENVDQLKKPLIEREYDLYFSGQLGGYNRAMMKFNLDKIKDKFKSNINYSEGFARGFKLNEYYSYLQNTKIAIVPNGAAIPESFRYFEAFKCNCIVITTYPKHIDQYNHWYYNNSPAIFLKEWREINEDLIKSLLTNEKIQEYQIKNYEYFNTKISTNTISKYMIDIIKK